MIKYIVFIFFLTPTVVSSQTEDYQTSKWETNFESATQKSTQEDKYILMVFSGSDWCKPCIQLRETVWKSDAFISFAQKNLVLLELDFPASKKNRLSKDQIQHNEALAEKYNPRGAFPAVVLIDKTGKEITRFDYHKHWTPGDYVNFIQNHI